MDNNVKVNKMLIDAAMYHQLKYPGNVTMRHQQSFNINDIIQFEFEDEVVLEPNLVRIVTRIEAPQDHRQAGMVYHLAVRH
jgi:hypothetical protein